MFPFLFQTMTLLVNVLVPSFCERARESYHYASKNVYANSNISQSNYKVCDRMATDLLLSSIKVTLLTYFSLILISLVPMYKLLFTNEREMIVPVILPFIDPDTVTGFYINLTNQLFTCFCGLIIIPGCEVISCILKNNCLSIAAVIENGLTEFKDLLINEKKFCDKHAYQFRNIILQILDFDKYVQCALHVSNRV